MYYFSGRPEKSLCANWPKLYRLVQKNALQRKIRFHLTYSEFDQLVRRSEGRCMLSGIPFEFERRWRGQRRPFAPSLDRINSAKGYVYSNCRLVCVAVNIAMNEWGLEPLLRVARELLKREAEILKTPEPPRYITIKEHLKENGLSAKPLELGAMSRKANQICEKQYVDRVLVQRLMSPNRRDGADYMQTTWAYLPSLVKTVVEAFIGSQASAQ